MRLLMMFLLILPVMGYAHTRHIPVKLGDTVVTIVVEKHGRGKSFIHVHQNETTALAAARTVVREHGGRLITLKHSGQRNIEFNWHHHHYEFDPNRIFTDRGIKKTLTLGGHYTRGAHRQVKHLAHAIKAVLPPGKVIAVHNNELYSLKDYFPGHSLAKDARRINTNKHHYYRNFYVVTQRSDFRRLSKQHFNSVWQARRATNDGSLSILLARRGYVNVEAGYDQLGAQVQMLEHA